MLVLKYPQPKSSLLFGILSTPFIISISHSGSPGLIRLESDIDIQCEILKLGHHGSNTSTSDAFLEAVDPDYGLISCSIGNKYLHPSPETVIKLKKHKVKIYRTDETGTVVLTITSDDVEFDKKKGDYKDGETLANDQNKKGG